MGHPPSEARRILRTAREGTDLRPLIEQARQIPDPSFAAEALFGISQERRLGAKDASGLLEEALRLTDKVERDWRRAEVLVAFGRRGAAWRDGDRGSAAAREGFRTELARRAEKLPAGEHRTHLLRSLAAWTPDAKRLPLLAKALGGPDPFEEGKAVLRGGPLPGALEMLAAHPDAGTAARLLAFASAHDQGGGLAEGMALAAKLPGPEQVEVVRAIIAALEDSEDLALVHDTLPADPDPKARLLCALAARSDKLGDPSTARAWLREAEGVAAAVPDGKPREKILQNIKAGMERLESAPKPKAAAAEPERAVKAPDAAARRHVLALIDTYEGKLGEVHVRAIARAAPLCWAFGLDLALVGFPAEDPERLVSVVEKQTNVGEGRGYLTRLAGEGRLLVGDERLPGFVVATTPSPDTARKVDFAGAWTKAKTAGAPRLIVLMGLGKHGLPGDVLREADAHLELTGQNVSLETATAMGIVADRLRQVPPL